MFNAARVVGTVSALTTPVFILVIVLSNEKNRKTTVVELFRRIVRKWRKWQNKGKKEEMKANRTSFLDELNSQRNSGGF